MALQYPSFAGLGVDAGGIMDAFDMGFDRARAQKQEKEAVEAFGKYIGGLGNPPSQQPMSLAALGQPQQAQPQTYAPPRQTDAPTQRIQSALGETSDRERQAMQFYISKGYSPHQAAGIVGNLIQESNLNTGAINPGDGADGSHSVGVAQWNGDRAKALQAFAAQNGGDPNDFNTQLAFVEHELNGSESGVRQRLLQAKDPIQAAAAFVGYERPQGWSADNPYNSHGWGNRAKHSARLAGGKYDAVQAVNAMASGQPVQMADASGQVAMPQQQLTPLPDADTMRALFAAPGTRQLAIALAQSRIKAQSDPMAAIEYQTAVEKLNQLRNGGNSDYTQRAQAAQQYGLDPNSEEGRNFILSGKLPEARGGAAELGLNPQYGVDENGNPALIQIGKDGKAVRTAMPEGVTLSKEPIKLDAGTHFVLLDPITRQPVGQIPKDLAGAERQKEIGQKEGAQIAAAPADVQNAQNALDLIEQIRTDPYIDRGTGMSSMGNAVPGTGGYDFANKVAGAKSGAFLSAIQQMRGLGSLSNAEGQAATDAVNRMDVATSKEAFLKALDDYENIVRQGMERARKRLPQGSSPSGSSNYKDKYGLD